MITIQTCGLAEKEHAKSERQYAHVFHQNRSIICVCDDWRNLPDYIRDAVLIHEVGHLIAGPKGGEKAANSAIESFFGIRVKYRDSEYGDDLEYLEPADLSRSQNVLAMMNLLKARRGKGHKAYVVRSAA